MTPTKYYRTPLPFGTFSTDSAEASLQLDTAYLTGVTPDKAENAKFHIFLPNNQGKLIRSTKEAIALALAAKKVGLSSSSDGVPGVLLVKDGILQLELGSPVNNTILVCNVRRDPSEMSGPAKSLLTNYQRALGINPGSNGRYRKSESAPKQPTLAKEQEVLVIPVPETGELPVEIDIPSDSTS